MSLDARDLGQIVEVIDDLIKRQQPTLRDMMAMAALTGLLSGVYGENTDNAKRAYDWADDMLEARKC